MRSRCLRLAACRFLRSELLLQPLLPAAAADLLSRYEPEHKYRQATCQRSLRPTDGTVPRVRLPDLHSDRSIAVADRPHVPTCACVWCLRRNAHACLCVCAYVHVWLCPPLFLRLLASAQCYRAWRSFTSAAPDSPLAQLSPSSRCVLAVWQARSGRCVRRWASAPRYTLPLNMLARDARLRVVNTRRLGASGARQISMRR